MAGVAGAGGVVLGCGAPRGVRCPVEARGATGALGAALKPEERTLARAEGEVAVAVDPVKPGERGMMGKGGEVQV